MSAKQDGLGMGATLYIGPRQRMRRAIFTGLGCGAVPFPAGADGTWRVKVVQAEDALGRMTTMTTRWRKGRT